jgi:hypothetical protein
MRRCSRCANATSKARATAECYAIPATATTPRAEVQVMTVDAAGTFRSTSQAMTADGTVTKHTGRPDGMPRPSLRIRAANLVRENWLFGLLMVLAALSFWTADLP